MSSQKEKLLIIGAGIGQAPLVSRAKAQGIHVTVATQPGQPCIEIADDVIFADIFDKETIADRARELGITAVISDQNDLMMPTVAYVASELGLPGNTPEQIDSYCNKNRYRDNCDFLGIPVPKHCEIKGDFVDCRLLPFGFPMMVKPADSQSSVGVRRVDNEKEYGEALGEAIRASRTRSAIVEEFFDGHEVVCEGFIEDGRYRCLSFGDRKYFNLPNMMIPSQTLFPSLIPKEYKDAIIGFESKMADYIQPSFAIVHSEYLVNYESGEIRAVESALRGGGVFISSDLIPLATGIDINGFLLDKARGKAVDVEKMLASRVDLAAGYVCFYLPEGVIEEGVDTSLLLNSKGVYKAHIGDIAPGATVERMVHKGLRKGPILLKADSRSDLDKYIELLRDRVRARVLCDGKASGIVWE